MLFNKEYSRPLRFLLAFFISLLITVPVIDNSQYLQFIDLSIIGDVQKHESAFLHMWYVFVSFLDSPKAGLVWILIIAFLLWGFKYKIQALWAMCNVFGGDVIDEVIKHIIKRPRPTFHPAADTGYSFPSGHVFSTFMVISVLWLVVFPLIKKASWRWFAYIVATIWLIFVMLARIYLNAHYPTDTFGAIAIGYMWLQISEWLYIKIAPILKKWPFTSHSYI
ncbi:phosphatase PAP2 family protein [Acetilactobacillus jinshanensis]|uniref:Phosphatase PAP2 family protein n=1 Tax=Acetilactobacillus jinshanensis TaxID=1720083 RepID=A0A4P6ZKN0_9LACO|nr:phosphatase PAP2 family protein [Acetilactobacillus jinshanensis]QBP17810.1 phosphatase PAP2 family protein [Acetilactobacillus jinshanensis]URL60672.1 phosphatase PAP2 family protein [uncultured bacterium]